MKRRDTASTVAAYLIAIFAFATGAALGVMYGAAVGVQYFKSITEIFK